jgi:hypothetical protein
MITNANKGVLAVHGRPSCIMSLNGTNRAPVGGGETGGPAARPRIQATMVGLARAVGEGGG